MDTTVKNAKMLIMHSEGMTYQEIADEFGMTRQGVQQAVATLYGRNNCTAAKAKHIERFVYPAIKAYFYENPEMSFTKFCRIAFGNGSTSLMGKVERLFSGGDSKLTILQIKQICDMIGKPFEEVFERDGNEENQAGTISLECER